MPLERRVGPSAQEVAVPLIPGAEPFAHDGGPVGALVVHGFTGSPVSMRPWAQALADAGLTVRLPRLPGPRVHLAGHGADHAGRTGTPRSTRAFGELTERCADVFVCGLSMGGSLALRLAELRGDEVRGLVLVNPSVHSENKALVALPVLRHVVRSVKGVGQRHRQAGPGRGLLRPGADCRRCTS